jgi:hypothetical protein
VDVPRATLCGLQPAREIVLEHLRVEEAERHRPAAGALDSFWQLWVAGDLGISLTPVRDAVNRLIAERVPERGGLGAAGAAVVPLLTPSLDQLMIIRSSLEPVAAGSGRGTPEPPARSTWW